MMDRRNVAKLLCAFAFAIAGSASSEAQVSVPVAPLAQEPQHDFIVILNDQLENVPLVRRATATRQAAIASAQTSVLSQLRQMGPRQARSFTTINAFATRLSSSEAEQLARHPDVKAVGAGSRHPRSSPPDERQLGSRFDQGASVHR
jgi:hypothetical protein